MHQRFRSPTQTRKGRRGGFNGRFQEGGLRPAKSRLKGWNSQPSHYGWATLWWIIPATVLMFAFAASSIPFGAWMLFTSRWPAWMTGWLKWPLGDHLSPRVIRLQGWSYVFIGEASLVLTVLLLFLPAILGGPTLQLRVIVSVVLSISVLLLICGVVPYVRSVMLSYHS
jgi:hypothetical protein